MYGASAGKIAETLGCSKKRGEELFALFWEGNPALKELKEVLISEFKSNGGKKGGYIRGLDGRKLFARSEHSLINLKFQSDGAILFKTAMVFLFSNWVPKKGIDAHLIISMHDELQADVAEKDVEKYSALALRSFEAAGKYYDYRVPIVGDVKVSSINGNWAETH